MSVFITAQVIGAIAVILSLTIFQMNRRGVMLRLAAVAAVLYGIHYFLIGAWTAVAMNTIAAARNIVFVRLTMAQRPLWILVIFLVAVLIGGLVTWQGPISAFAMLATMLSCIATWQRDPKVIRRVAMVVPPLWFIYAFAAGSYPGMFVEIVILVSNVIGQYRFDYRHAATTHRHAVRHA